MMCHRAKFRGEINQTVAVMVQTLPIHICFSIFKMAAIRHLGYLKNGNFNGRYVQMVNWRTVPNFLAMSESNHYRYRRFFDFKDGGPPLS